MYVDSSTVRVKGKEYTRHLLRESYREGGKVKHRTVANISQCKAEEVEAIRLALRHKKELGDWVQAQNGTVERQGPSVGAVCVVYAVARELGIVQALGPSRQGKLALWQIIARVLDQGSRLSAVRLAGSHAACSVLGIEKPFNEDALYANLDWLYQQQSLVEDRMHKRVGVKKQGELFLYDVTSSYFEGTRNELAAFGYNRDGKKGKRQIVVGLLCDQEGDPLSIEVFVGNTQDAQTLGPQIQKAVRRFGGKSVTFVGDRGMIKSPQMGELNQWGFHYITAITKPQIEKMLKDNVIQLGLFDQHLAEVSTEHVRYILRRNPMRALQIQATRDDKLAVLERKIGERNHYLAEHPRAKVATALKQINSVAKRLKIATWLSITGEESARAIQVCVRHDQLAEESKLDGCYVLKTDLVQQVANKELVHSRYKDLALVEKAFRTSKTVQLELRPIHVRLASRTCGHAFVVMMAYRIVRRLSELWKDLDITVQEGLNELSTLCSTLVEVNGHVLCQRIPTPRPSVQLLLDEAGITLPEALPHKEVNVTTKKKLQSRRLSR